MEVQVTMKVLYASLALSLFNFINSRLDAYRILKNKTIAHGINFGLYFILFLILVFLCNLPLLGIGIFAVSAFTNRQVTFDIPLNLRRGLDWDYVSLDNPPKALMDKIEVGIFGYNGTAPTLTYVIIWLLTLIYYILKL